LEKSHLGADEGCSDDTGPQQWSEAVDTLCQGGVAIIPPVVQALIRVYTSQAPFVQSSMPYIYLRKIVQTVGPAHIDELRQVIAGLPKYVEGFVKKSENFVRDEIETWIDEWQVDALAQQENIITLGTENIA
jgi:hypothetical protein